MKSYYKKVILFLILVGLLTALVTSLFFFSPEELVDRIGVGNSYFLLFVVSFFGGFSAGGSVSFISLLTTFAIGGLNPIFLGITAGIALAIGDVIMFILGEKGRELVVGKWEKRINKFSNFVKNKAKGFIPLIAYIYIGFTPFPNDLLILSLAAIEYPRKKVYLPIILGDLTFAIMIALLASKGMSWFF